MNHVYTVLWNAVLGRFSVVSELGRKRSRATTQRRTRPAPAPARLPVLTMLVAALAWAAPSRAERPSLPQDAKVIQGTATVETADKHMTITQTSSKAILNWKNFDIGKDHQVRFVQPDASSVALNRVVGRGSHSEIAGTLNANGQVFLVNPNGVLFGPTAMVNAGSLVASSLDISDKDFMAGRYQFELPVGRAKAGQVINLGQLTAADGGAVALLGGYVENRSQVSAKLGLITLAAGQRITLDFEGDQRLQVIVDQPAFKSKVINSGLLDANGGNVWMTAGATDALLQTVINNTGQIRANKVDNLGGRIWLSGATTQVAGTLDVSAEQGDGGKIQISASRVQIMPRTQFSARAMDGQGKTGSLRVEGRNLHVSAEGAEEADSQIDAGALSGALNEGDVTLVSGTGDIHVDAPVDWKQNRLTLKSPGSINVNSVMTASGTAALELFHKGDIYWDPLNSDRGLHMALSTDGFTGRIDFKDVSDEYDADNPRLQINDRSYVLLNHVGEHGSTADRDLQSTRAGLGSCYALAADIDAAGLENFKPLGGEHEFFGGQFDGLGHRISNLTINEYGDHPVGLFAVSHGHIRNMALSDVVVKGRGKPTVSILGKLQPTGSLVGEMGHRGRISNVHVTATVEADARGPVIAGSVVGAMKGGNLINIYAHGSVKATSIGSGPLQRGPFRKPQNDSAIKAGTYALAGGIAGHVGRDSSIRNAHTTADVSATAEHTLPDGTLGPSESFVGGAFGMIDEGVYQDVTAVGEVATEAIGASMVSMHQLVGNDPHAIRGAMDDLQHHPGLNIEPDPSTQVISAAVAELDVGSNLSSTAPSAPAVPSIADQRLAVSNISADITATEEPRQIEMPVDSVARSVMPFEAQPDGVPGPSIAASRVHDAPPAIDIEHRAQAVPVVPVVSPTVVSANALIAPVPAQALPVEPSLVFPGQAAVPRVRVQGLPAHAAAMATMGRMGRATPPAAAKPDNESPLYTVVGHGIQRPKR